MSGKWDFIIPSFSNKSFRLLIFLIVSDAWYFCMVQLETRTEMSIYVLYNLHKCTFQSDLLHVCNTSTWVFSLISYDHMISTNSTKQERNADVQPSKTQAVSPGNKMVNAHEKQKYKNSERKSCAFVGYSHPRCEN